MKQFAGIWRKLLGYIRPYLPAVTLGLICAVFSTVLTLLGPDRFSELSNLILAGITDQPDLRAIREVALTLVLYYGAGSVLHMMQNWIMTTTTQRISGRLRRDISTKINRLPMWFYNRTTTGDVLSRVTNDVDAISQSLQQSVGNLLTALALFFGAVLLMALTNGTMALTAIATSLLGFGFLFAMTRKSQRHFSRLQKDLGELNGHIEEIYAGHTIVKAYNAEAQEKETFARHNEAMRRSAFRAQCFSGMMQPFMGFVGNLGYVAVCIVGALLVERGRIEFGVIVAFMIYVRLFTQPLSQIAQSVQSLQSAAAAGERVFAFLEAEELEDEAHKQPCLSCNVAGNVEFDHVRFGYEDSDRIIIKDLSVKVSAGQKIAIVGPTGAGKTTLVNLLMRFHELKGGEIRLEGIPITKMSRKELRSQFCMVLQDTWLFEGTIRENLVYNLEQVSEETVIRACKAVGLHRFICTLPRGYDTELNDTVSLSAGQKQQMTIARAMIADRPILILDEATSSIDTRTERKIQQAMDALMKDRTAFVIAHRLSTIQNADLILVLKDGDVVERGTHEELLQKNGFYAKLYQSQFEETA